MTRNTTCRPSSRNDGHTCAVSAVANVVKGAIDPSTALFISAPLAAGREHDVAGGVPGGAARRCGIGQCRHRPGVQIEDAQLPAGEESNPRSVRGPEWRHGPDRCPAARGFRRCAGPAARASPPQPWRRGRRADGRPGPGRVQIDSRNRLRAQPPRPATRWRAAAGAAAEARAGAPACDEWPGPPAAAATRTATAAGKCRVILSTSDLKEVASHA